MNYVDKKGWLVGSIVVDKVEKILKGSLDSIPSLSPSVKIQMMGGKVFFRYKGKTLGVVNKLFVFKSLLTTPSNFALTTKAHFPAHNLNFH